MGPLKIKCNQVLIFMIFLRPVRISLFFGPVRIPCLRQGIDGFAVETICGVSGFHSGRVLNVVWGLEFGV